MTGLLRCRGIWQGVVAVSAAAMVASCGTAGAHGGPVRSTPAAAGPTVRAGPTVQAVGSPPPSRVLGYQLNGVAASSATSAWAAGSTNRITVHMIGWDGRTWRRVPTHGAGYLNGVAVISAVDAWAVGAKLGNNALIEHWNGKQWTPVAAPGTGGPAVLHAVTASPGAVWAVGGTNFTGKTVILRWNGTAWTRVSSPTPPGVSSELDGVAATSATNAWAVGYTFTKTDRIPLIEHWNGTVWRQVPSPALPGGGILHGVAATSATSAWAVGSSNGALIEHWNGTAWTRVSSPTPPAMAAGLDGVAATSATSAWAVGETLQRSRGEVTLIERWNGRAWAPVPSPAMGLLAGVTATSARNAWAVGYSTAYTTGIIEHWNGGSWTCPSATGKAGPCPQG